MKKLILILSVLFFFSCKKNDCYLFDNAGNTYEFKGNNRVAWGQYVSSGKTTINGIEFDKNTYPLFQICH